MANPAVQSLTDPIFPADFYPPKNNVEYMAAALFNIQKS